MHTWFWWGSQKQTETTRNPYTVGKIILKWILAKEDVVVWTGFVWLRIGTNSGLL
jgi:hypothetical protein